MRSRKLRSYLLFTIICLFHAVRASVCPDTPSCNCTAATVTDLQIVCESTPALTQLPSLVPSALQRTITYVRVQSTTTADKGPLIRLPTNLCTYPVVTILDLSSNSIDGLVDTSELACLSSTLTHLDLSSNNISGVNLTFLKTAQVLQSINVAQNRLINMPMVDVATFVRFPSTLVSINVSFNQITNVDLWPLFVKTGKIITIDLSYNLIEAYTNNIPVSVRQLTENPDPRFFLLNNNRLAHLSDYLLEYYDACDATDSLSRAYFIVGISNMLLTGNPLLCDCESYYLVTYINDNLNDFPQIANRSALLARATCAVPSGQSYIFRDFTDLGNCPNYVPANVSSIFCTLSSNDTRPTVTPPTYWPTTTRGQSNGSGDASSSRSSTAFPWYIILAIILGLLLVVALIVVIVYCCRQRLCPKRFGKNNPALLLQAHRKGNYDAKARRDRRLSASDPHAEQETQTNFQPSRSKTPGGRRFDPLSAAHRDRRGAPPPAVEIGVGTAHGVRGIPIAALPVKMPSQDANAADTAASELSVKAISVTPAKRAKPLPHIRGVRSAFAADDTLLNTTAGALMTNERQRRRSLFWNQKQTPTAQPPLPPRPHSTKPKATKFAQDDEDGGLPRKPSKPLRSVPLLNIAAVPTGEMPI